MTIEVAATLDTVRLAMELEQGRARVAAENIAMANVQGRRPMRLDVAVPLARLKAAAVQPESFARVLSELQRQDQGDWLKPLAGTSTMALDSEVAEVAAASGRYQRLADAVSRQFALMQLAVRGGR